MAAVDRGIVGGLFVALLAGTTLFGYTSSVTPAYAQTALPAKLQPKVADDARLQLAANELLYNKDQQVVSAVGGVQINYGRYHMVAQRVEYNQQTQRLMAYGNIELVSPDGNRIYADKLDITNDFGNGFINALRIETTDNTRIVAESGERVGGTQMILNKGVYTACLPCSENPQRSPIWQVKAERVIQNGQTHTIRLEKARFELFGQPIAYVPWVEVPDNTVKRKSGFLFPSFSTSNSRGFGLTVPYYYVISPSMDATVTGTGYTNQGFLLEGEFRQRFENGTHVLRMAGIDQANPDKFSQDANDSDVKLRGMVSSKADFKINPRWSFGWDIMAQSDNNFSRTYGIKDAKDYAHTNQVYLTGLGERNYFDMRAFYFDVQDGDPNSTVEKEQPIVYPSLDYHYVAPQPVYGGELSADVNLTNLTRRGQPDFLGTDRYVGLQGQYSRLSTELEWKRTYITPAGVLLTPLLAARGDALSTDMDRPFGYSSEIDDGFSTRGMVTAGLEARYPILATTQNSTHLFEPIAQIYARPNEMLSGRLPNEDAQSFVFDATNLFERDKFSGYDRIEGGTRANVGIQYTGTFDNGYKLHGLFGQSYRLAGENAFTSNDLTQAGADSGLDSDVSDYVGMAGIETPQGFSFAASYRLDQKDFEVKRSDLTAGFETDYFQSQLLYTHLSPQPDYGFDDSADELQARATVKFKDYWSVFGGVAWDINSNVVTKSTIGFAYEDECTIFSIAYVDQRDVTDESSSDWSIGAKLTFRTLGDVNVGSSTDYQKNIYNN